MTCLANIIAVLLIVSTHYVCFAGHGPHPTPQPTAAPPTSLTAVQGTFGYTITTASDQMNWRIAPTTSITSLQIAFSAMDVTSAEFGMFNCSNNHEFFKCNLCDYPVPPPFVINSNCVNVKFKGVAGVLFRTSTVTINYVGELARIADATPSLTSYSLALTAGAGKVAPTLVGIGGGQKRLFAGSVQQWRITLPVVKPITLSISLFNFSDAGACAATLRIYDDNKLLYSGCRQSDVLNTWLFATSGKATINVTTTSTVQAYFVVSWFTDVDVYRCGSVTYPNYMADDSMILSDGTQSTNSMRQNEGPCGWLLQPSNTGTVTLIFTLVDLYIVNSAVPMTVADSDGQTLWSVDDSIIMGVVPPPIISTGPSLFVSYASGTSSATAGYKGFRGIFYSNNNSTSTGVGDHKTLLRMSSNLDILPPGDGATMYAPSLNYSWLIEPKTTLSNSVTFVFSKLSLTDCSNDKLVLYDGATTAAPVLGTFCGTKAPAKWYKTSTKTSLLTFSTDSANNLGNFQLAYFTDGPNYHCGFTRSLATLTAVSMTITDGSSSTQSMYFAEGCTWTIQPQNASGVTLFFNRFDLKGGTLTIYLGPAASGQQYVVISNVAAIPSPIYFPSNAVIGIQYTSAATGAMGKGFSMTYYGDTSDSVGPGDSTVKLFCSTLYSLRLPKTSSGHILASGAHNLTWQVQPATSGKVYFSFTFMNLTDCSSRYLNIYDGTTASPANLLGKFCGHPIHGMRQSPYNKWLVTSLSTALIEFVSLSPTEDDSSKHNDFELSFYADGPNNHCGFTTNPATLNTPSMIFTDGSTSTASMASNQYCEWLIDPAESVFGENVTDGGVHNRIMVEFLNMDLGGGQLNIYDGKDSIGDPDNALLLFSCTGCTNIPRPILSNSSSLFVQFISYGNNGGAAFGTGFQALYYTVVVDKNISSTSPGISSSSLTSLSPSKAEAPRVLEVPVDASMTGTADNETASFYLGVDSYSFTTSTLLFQPRYTVLSSEEVTDSDVLDGRANNIFPSLTNNIGSCGTVQSTEPSYYADEDSMSFLSSQLLSSYLMSSIGTKTMFNITGDWSPTTTSSPSLPFAPEPVCKYFLKSEDNMAINIKVNRFTGNKGGRLRIYTGVYGVDLLAYDSATQSNSGETRNINVMAPCGLAVVILDNNSTFTSNIDYGVQISYDVNPLDRKPFTSQTQCDKYKQSLLPVVVEEDPLLPLYYLAAAVGTLLVLIAIGIRIYRNKDTIYNFKMKKRVKRVEAHPRHNPKWDNFMARFLPNGTCCVCQDSPVKVLIIGKCTHMICLECLKSYLISCLGDISSFPVKCPMHYAGCTCQIGPVLAKRVLVLSQYERFLEFHDRAVFGEGMRCIFCNNFVIFPEAAATSMCECPFCVQKFCMRCKKPWHYGSKCPLDTADESLELWKTESGAQKCPACAKTIEKSDPDTCNHMIHKITDGIPCIRDRCDFCYLCGEEVMPDYPHDEVKNPGVNHFPDGVFQKCLKLIQREREAERERLKKIKRQRNNAKQRMQERNSNVVLPTTDAWGGGDDVSKAAPVDSVDAQWNMALAPSAPAVPAVPAAPAAPAAGNSPARPRTSGAGGGATATTSNSPARPSNANGQQAVTRVAGASPTPSRASNANAPRGIVPGGVGGAGGANSPARAQQQRASGAQSPPPRQQPHVRAIPVNGSHPNPRSVHPR